MKRYLLSLLLLLALTAGLIQPAFATETVPAETELPAETSEYSEVSEPDESSAADEPTENEPDPAERPATRSVQTYTVSDRGRAFVSEMMNGSYSEDALTSAASTVNSFITRYSVSLTQQQFDALVDLVMNYGSSILTSGKYMVEKVIKSGSYTDLEIANAFCSWVTKDGTFSQETLTRRLREIKLFLYDSYDGNTDKVTFRYVVFYGNGGSLNDNTVLCYSLGGTYNDLPTASRSGWYFAGWYTASTGGTHLCNRDTVSQNQTVYAHWSEAAVSDPNSSGSTGPTEPTEPTEPVDPSQWPELPPLKISEQGIQFIKDHEGFIANPVWDYAQYSIGYGSRYDPENSPIPISAPITEEEADYLLRSMLASFEAIVDKLLSQGTVEHTQAQYDAIISFTYNLGQQWMQSDLKTYQYILFGGCTEMEFVNTLGSWCKAGGSILPGLCRRRIDEANLYLNGDYTLGSKKYVCIIYNGAKGTVSRQYSYYLPGESLGTMPTATRDGYRLTGWYDKLTGGTQYTSDTIAPSAGVLTLYAHWEEGTPDPTTPTEPAEPTEPTEPAEPTEPTKPTPAFKDVSTDAWYYEWVMQAVEAGLFGGVSETEFEPDSPMTRAMLVTVLYRYDGEQAVSSKAPFADMEAGQWYSDAVDWAYENGIVNGISPTRFGVDEYVTREQLTTMLYRFAAYRGYDTTARKDLSAFTDASRVLEYALEAMQWACAEGIVSGDGSYLLPQGNATRAHCAKMMTVFLDRFLE